MAHELGTQALVRYSRRFASSKYFCYVAHILRCLFGSLGHVYNSLELFNISIFSEHDILSYITFEK